MSAVRALKDVEDMQVRAAEHSSLAQVLFDTEQEWAAVCGFYAAYHLMRASFLADPIFEDETSLLRINSKLTSEDRFAEKHSKGGLSAASFGVNEIVTVLYPHVRGRYGRLHIASCQVRYGKGLDAFKLSDIQEDWEVIGSEYKAGNIVHSS